MVMSSNQSPAPSSHKLVSVSPRREYLHNLLNIKGKAKPRLKVTSRSRAGAEITGGGMSTFAKDKINSFTSEEEAKGGG